MIKATEVGARNRKSLHLDLKRVAAYCRVSTDTKDQIESYKSQVDYYTNLINNNSDWNLVGIYADEATTGTTINKRANFIRLIKDCQSGNIDMIITKSISRFARNTLDTLKYVRLLKENNVGVVFEEENIDTLTMDGELLLTILSSVAQQEVENTSAHVKKGLKMKMERGELVGFQGCLGYDYDPITKKIIVNKEEAKIVRYIFKRYLEGNGGSVIARDLENQGILTPRGKKKWSDTTILGVIKNEKYIGDIVMGKTFTVDPITKRRLANFGEFDKYHIENHHEAIISKEDFDKAQEIRLRRASNRNTIKNKGRKREKLSRQYAFSSMLECGFCGEILSRRTWHTGTIYKKINWQCVKSTKKGKKYCPHSKGIQEVAIENAFIESYNQLCSADSSVIDDFLQIVKEEISDDSLEKDLNKIDNKINRLMSDEAKLIDLHLENKISEDNYTKKFNKISKQRDLLVEEKKVLEITIKDDNSIKDRLKEFRKALENKNIVSKFNRVIFESIVDKVVVGRVDPEGNVYPYDLTFYFKTGVNKTKNSNKFKTSRKDINKNLCTQTTDEDINSCTQSKDHARGNCIGDTKTINLEILNFTQFHKHFSFERVDDYTLKKVLKNSINVRVILQLVCWDTRTN